MSAKTLLFYFTLSFLFLITIDSGNADTAKLIPLDGDFASDKSIVLLSKQEREKYLLKVDTKGRLTDVGGKLLDTRNVANGTAIFVLSKNNKLYIAVHRRYLKFNHASFVSKEDVTVAGTVSIRRGRLKFITDNSSTYVTRKKDEKPLRAAIKKLRLMGADLAKMRVFFHWNL